MKTISETFKFMKFPETVNTQFSKRHPDKNILFVTCQLTGRNLYRYILPYLMLFEYVEIGEDNRPRHSCRTALIGLERFKKQKQYVDIDVPLTSKQIVWADYIVFPFTIQPLASVDQELMESGKQLRSLYEHIKMINPNIKIVYNVDFNYYEISKLHPLYKIFSDKQVVQDIEDNIFFSDITLCTNANLIEYLTNKFKNELNQSEYKSYGEGCEIGAFPMLIDEPIVLENVKEQEDDERKNTPDGKLRIGMILTEASWEDVNAYKKELKEIKKKHGDNVEIIAFGFDGIHEETKKSAFEKDFDFEYVKPCTIIHYFRMLKSLNLDLVFIPLRKNDFNLTSENYNKFMEAGILKVPVLAPNAFPYASEKGSIITDGENGFIFNTKKEFAQKIDSLIKDKKLLKTAGEKAYNTVIDHFTYHADNTPMIINQIFN